MPPASGSIHRVARVDSGLTRLWPWARKRKKPWSADEAAAACGIRSRSRCRAIVAALRAAGLIEMVDDQENHGHRNGPTARTWRLTEAARAIESAPVMVVRQGVVTGVRAGATA